MKSFVGEKAFIIAQKNDHEDSIFSNLDYVLIGTY